MRVAVSGIARCSPKKAIAASTANRTNIISHGKICTQAAPTSGPSSGAISATLAIKAVILMHTASSKDSCIAA